MLPANSGIAGWATEVFSTQLLYPRNDAKAALVAKSYIHSQDKVWQLSYAAGNFILQDEIGDIQSTLTVAGVLSCDLAFDQLDRALYVWEQEGDQVWLYWYNPISASHVQVQIATGNNPCCCMDERRVVLTASSDVFIFYQRGDAVFYRLQRDRFLVEYDIPQPATDVRLETCGMGTNNRLTIRTANTPSVIFGLGGKPMTLDGGFVGYPDGVNPWHRN